jgi:hypothetical protein
MQLRIQIEFSIVCITLYQFIQVNPFLFLSSQFLILLL